MSQQELYMYDFFSEMKPIVKRLYISHCSIDKINFFCDCIFNILSGNIQMIAPASRKQLYPHRKLIDLLNNKKVGIRRKRHSLSTTNGLRLLRIIQPSVSNHLKKRHGIKQ